MVVSYRKPRAKLIAERIIYQGRVYALTNEKTLEAPIVVTGMLLIDNFCAEVLFNLVPHILIS